MQSAPKNPIDSFQAKDIQEICDIPKFRYEYLKTKMGINPDVSEAEGQGKTHLYSFKNLMHFGIANAAGIMGLTPKTTKNLLSHLDLLDETEKIDIFDKDESLELDVYYILSGGVLHRTDSLSLIKRSQISVDVTGKDPWEMPDKEFSAVLDLVKKDSLSIEYQKYGMGFLKNTEGYVVLNIGKIKENIISKL